MTYINRVVETGNLTWDPEKIGKDGNVSGCKFGLCSSKEYGPPEARGKRRDFFQVEVWGPQAKRCLKELKKGSRVIVVGDLVYGEWEDSGGKKRSDVRITGRAVGISLEGKANSGNREDS